MTILKFIFIAFIALSVQAEQKYFTWVDAQGNVHSTPIESSEKKEVIPPDEAEGSSFLTEEEFERQRAQDKENNPAFFTWTDAEGRIHNSVKPEYVVEFEAPEVVADSVFAPPFRLPIQITKGECCQQYAQAFSLEAGPVGVVKIDEASLLYKTRDKSFPAAYFNSDIKSGWLGVKLYGMSDGSTIELVLLNKDFEPIYLASDLEPMAVGETWSHHGYHKLILELNDADIEYMILFSTDFSGAEYSASLKYDISEL